MNKILGSILSRVICVKINGPINKKMTNNIAQGLHKSRFYKPQAIVVTINSNGGSISQAKSISDILKKYSNQKNIPIYCFAQDVCLSSSHIILTSGVKCYANSMTLLGDFGFCWGSLWFDKFRQKYNIKDDNMKGKQNTISLHPLKQISKESEEWMRNYLKSLQKDLKKTIIENRTLNNKKLKISENQLLQKLENKGCITSEQGVKYGIIDGIMDSDELIYEKFKGVEIFQIGQDQFSKYSKSQIEHGKQWIKSIRQNINNMNKII